LSILGTAVDIYVLSIDVTLKILKILI